MLEKKIAFFFSLTQIFRTFAAELFAAEFDWVMV